MFQDALKHYHKAYYAGELHVMPKPGGPFWKKSQGSSRRTDVDSTSELSDWFTSQVNIHSVTSMPTLIHLLFALTSPISSDASPTNSDVSPTNSDISPINSNVSPISSDVSPINSDVSPPNSYSVPPVRPAHFCHTFRYIPCFLPVTYLSPCCYLLLPCVYPFHVFPPLMCFSYSVFHMSCVYHKDPVLSVSI